MTRTWLDWRGDAPLPPSLAATGRDRLATLAAGDAGADADALPGDAARVLACSDFVFSSCERHPAMFADLVSSGDLGAPYPAPLTAAADRPSLQERAEAAAGAAETIEALMVNLRRLRRREMVRIAWRDIGGLADFEETVGDTSDLADAIIGASVGRLHEWQCTDLGTPIGHSGEPQELVVLALGKLGASELNFSSDIDLIFTFPENGQTEGGRRSVDNDRFFLQLARKLMRVLGEPTADGFVYRVDMRLRPFGTQGPLVLSFDALEEYYQTHGRDWERYALIRARAVSGDLVLAAELLERLRPFVYRRYIDFGTLASLRSLKAVMEQEVARKGMEHSVKHGPGGIREVEFTAQAFQMVRGGRTPALRYRRLLTVLARLRELELLPAHAVESLGAAYRFLRAAEHRLQQVADRQEHMLPVDESGRERIAAAMGYASWDAFFERLERHRRNVDEQFGQVFGEERGTDGAGGSDPLGTLLADTTDEATGTALLEEAGFADAREAWSILARRRDAIALRMPDALAHERLTRLLPDLMRAVAAQGADAPTTLDRVMSVVESVAKRSVYLALLAERPVALSQCVQLCAASPWIAQLLGRHPVLFDELLDPRTLYAPLAPDELDRDIAERLNALDDPDREHEMDCLRQSKQANVLRVAAADISRRIPLMVVSDHLTWIAEADSARGARDRMARHHLPPWSTGVDAPRRDLPALCGHRLREARRHRARLRLRPRSRLRARRRPARDDHGAEADRSRHLLCPPHPAAHPHPDRPDPAGRALRGGPATAPRRIEGGARQHARRPWGVPPGEGVDLGAPGPGEGAGGGRRPRAGTAVCGPAARHPASRAGRRHVARRGADHAPAHARRARLGSLRPIRPEAGSRAEIADIEFMVQYGTLRWASRLGADVDWTDNIRLLEGFERAGTDAGGGRRPCSRMRTVPSGDGFTSSRCRTRRRCGRRRRVR